ncbi:N-formylglutamate amidohydrolase [Hyphococcus sp. DH-69]|uniref:N-formylglutamate amidohydrolase n=1 Tax=Hyphococcus formosus TaxID=3143534 RepID=UPI00398ACBE1
MPEKFDRPTSYRERRPIDVLTPNETGSAVIFASPHSGRDYPTDLLRNSRLDHHALRQSEDSYVDLLFDEAPRFGSPLLRALFPRAYVDVNRSREELDPRMFADSVPRSADTRSSRVIAGLGVIPRIVADGQDIYGRKLYYIDARRRLSACYDPYHKALRGLVDEARARFGCAILIDCHSMPSAGGAPFRTGEPPIDFVLGDRFGTSCAPEIIRHAEEILTGFGYQVTRNAPYAGGYVAASYGRPRNGVHALQIEINRALYLDERRIARTDAFEALREHMIELMRRLTGFDVSGLCIPQAAE